VHSRNVTRVRWDASERAQLVQQSQLVLAERPGDPLKDVIAQAMLSLPAARRRKVDGKTVLWIREAVRALPPLSRTMVPSSHGAEAPPSQPVALEVTPVAHAEPAITEPKDSTGPLTAALVESAVDVLVGILTHPRLRLAVRNLLTEPTSPAPDEDKRLVVVAGLPAADAKTVEKTFAGMLPVRIWSVEQTREQLEAIVEDARLVIGMSNLTQAVDSSLSRLGSRYVRNQGGIQGLHKRLAEEAMK
jgi:hypothetical protein